MMPSPSIYNYSNARHSYRLSAGIAQARIAALHSIAVTRPILSRYPQIARSHRRMQPSFAASRSRRPLESNLSKPEPAANPYSARGAAPHTSHDFVPWRFLDAGYKSARIVSASRRPKTCTKHKS